MWSIAFSNVSLSKFVKNVLLTYLLIPLGKKKKSRYSGKSTVLNKTK